MKLSSALKSFVVKNCGVAADATDDQFLDAIAKAKDTLPMSKSEELRVLIKQCIDEADAATAVKAKDVFGSFRVKAAAEQYCSTKSVGRHVRTNQPVSAFGKSVETASE